MPCEIGSRRSFLRACVLLFTLLWLLRPASAGATTYYVRTDGGSTTRCTGLADAADPGSGTGQACAWDHPFRALPPGGTPRISGGDTLIIRAGSYKMGYGATGADLCDSSGPWGCYMPPIPSGTNASNPTRILGYGYDTGCTNPPELWGTERTEEIFNLTDSSNVEISCFTLTDHSGCVESHASSSLACNRDTSPYGDWAIRGIYAEDSTSVALKHLDIHGFAVGGILAGRLKDWTVEDVRIAGNGWVGWDGDISLISGTGLGTSNSGNMTFKRFTVEWNGCAETYPGQQPTGCWAQESGGYGDGFGTGATAGIWLFEDSKFLHNTSDGLDLLYGRTGASFTIRRTIAEGNAGNQIKTNGPATIENSILVGNCAFFHAKSFTYTATSSSYTSGTVAWNDDCRALGVTLALTLRGGSEGMVTVRNNTLKSEGDCLVTAECDTAVSPCNGTERITMRNNIFIGDTDYLQNFESSCLAYVDPPATSGLSQGNAVFDIDYSIVTGVKDSACPGTHHTCGGSSGVTNSTLTAFNARLSSGSIAIDAGTATGGTTTDFENLARDTAPDLGAYEYRSCTPTLGATSASVGGSATTGSVSVTTSGTCAWAATSSVSWIVITSGSSGTTSGTVSYSVMANSTGASRTGTMTIAGQTFTLTQSSGSTGSCTYTLGASSASVGSAATTGSVSVTVSGSSCSWTATSNASWITITSGSSGATSGTVGYSVSANTTGASRSGTLTIGGRTFTITQSATAGASPTMALDRTSLAFGATTTGAAFVAQTGTQTVRLTQSGTGTVTWTASSSASWLAVSPASGTGSASLSVSVQFANGLSSSQTGSLTITLTGASNTVGPVSVSLAVIQNGTSSAPYGSFDTPAEGTTGITGSIGVTGWVLDDVESSRVRILRDPVAGEGQTLQYIGDAVFVEGARSDVATTYSTAPRSTRAGWGYLLLTNFLPNGGNGTFKLYADAIDVDGHASTILGSKTITCDNAHAAEPFGAIDTPAQGATVSGSVTNFGWVLSPGGARADPPGGGTVSVVLDGVIGGSPSGWTSRSDLTALFPSSTYSGVSTALGVAGFDSTTMTNGVHTISWLVRDNQSRAAGIGSRYFTVSNGSALRAADQTVSVPGLATAPGWVSTPMEGRRGYDLDAPFRTFTPDETGLITIQSEELDRIELKTNATAGSLRTRDGLRPLPIGSRLQADGTFTWQPGVGFVGPYDIVFESADGPRQVRIVLNPKVSNRVGPQVVIDIPAAGREVSGDFTIAGWAADLGAANGTGIDTLHVWAYPADGGGPVFVGVAAQGGLRPDVAAIYGDQFGAPGYGLIVRGLAPGVYDVAVFAFSSAEGGFLPARTVRVIVR